MGQNYVTVSLCIVLYLASIWVGCCSTEEISSSCLNHVVEWCISTNITWCTLCTNNPRTPDTTNAENYSNHSDLFK